MIAACGIVTSLDISSPDMNRPNITTVIAACGIVTNIVTYGKLCRFTITTVIAACGIVTMAKRIA